MYDPIRASDEAIQRLRAHHPSLIDLTTGRVERLLGALGDPHRRLPPVVHVAGTNGKGSTVAYLRAIAEAAGATLTDFGGSRHIAVSQLCVAAGPRLHPQLLALLRSTQTATESEPIDAV